jgi:hypothetical protein
MVEAKSPLVEFAAKFKCLCEQAGISVHEAELQISNHGIKISTLQRWRTEAIWITKPSRTKFFNYWRVAHKFDLSPDILEMPMARFEKYMAENRTKWRRVGHEAMLDRALPTLEEQRGVYQVIRPHTTDPHRFILEAMEIELKDDVSQVLFYSHNRRDIEALYEGDAVRAERYCFALMSRAHEKHLHHRSFRAIAIFVGEQAEEHAMSGLLLRGLSSRLSQLAALPFLAIKDRASPSLRTPEFVKADNGGSRLWKLGSKGSVLVGEVDEKCPELQEHCRSMLSQCWDGRLDVPGAPTKGAPEGIVFLRSLDPVVLRRIRQLDINDWAALIDKIRFVAS